MNIIRILYPHSECIYNGELCYLQSYFTEANTITLGLSSKYGTIDVVFSDSMHFQNPKEELYNYYKSLGAEKYYKILRMCFGSGLTFAQTSKILLYNTQGIKKSCELVLNATNNYVHHYDDAFLIIHVFRMLCEDTAIFKKNKCSMIMQYGQRYVAFVFVSDNCIKLLFDDKLYVTSCKLTIAMVKYAMNNKGFNSYEDFKWTNEKRQNVINKIGMNANNEHNKYKLAIFTILTEKFIQNSNGGYAKKLTVNYSSNSILFNGEHLDYLDYFINIIICFGNTYIKY